MSETEKVTKENDTRAREGLSIKKHIGRSGDIERMTDDLRISLKSAFIGVIGKA